MCTDSETYKDQGGQFEGLTYGKMLNTTLYEISDKNISCGYSYYGDELNPNGQKTPGPDPFDNAFDLSKQVSAFPPYRELVDNEERMSYGRNIGVVNELNATKYNLDVDKLTQFMSKNDDFSDKKRGPDYLIFDNIQDFFSDKQAMDKLRGFR